MLKERKQLVEVFFVIFDLFFIAVAWVLAYYLRFYSGIIPVDKGIPPFSQYFWFLIIVFPIWFLAYKLGGLYVPLRATARRIYESFLLIRANSIAILVLISYTYLVQERTLEVSRLVLFYFAILSILFGILERSLLRKVLRDIRRKGYNLKFMLIVGGGKVAKDVAERFRKRKDYGIQLIGCLNKTGVYDERAMLPILGKYEDLREILSTKQIDMVVVALPLEDNHTLPIIMKVLGDSVVDVKIVPDVYQFISVGGFIQDFDGLPVLGLQESTIDGINYWIKRIFDIVFSIIFIIIFSPLMIVIAFLVKLTSKGPCFYKQERMSLDGSSFQILKFRTMIQDSEKAGPGWTTKNDNRVTKIGRFLRSYSLDELPQLFNVLKGDMSLVGPRPERPVYIEEFRKNIPLYMLRHKVKSGMTGYAQIKGWRGDTSIDKRIECDLYYIENWSIFFDLKILFLTIFCGFKNTNAY
ncbi:MAG: undecaprenyl-phosphate glucose phosphotransferase [Bdellovibrionota bacterium]|nr:undecaprenyl-phosphate glucose phosphotransferase [Pseudomonadota bacterium]MDY6090480.1 undecaprenyl-phosphate glucose phosphotransferase [Bdellovibrionota bacterium]